MWCALTTAATTATTTTTTSIDPSQACDIIAFFATREHHEKTRDGQICGEFSGRGVHPQVPSKEGAGALVFSGLQIEGLPVAPPVIPPQATRAAAGSPQQRRPSAAAALAACLAGVASRYCSA